MRLGDCAVGGALELARGRPGGRQKPGELALREHVLEAPVAERQLARGVELLMAGGQDDGADGDLLLPGLWSKSMASAGHAVTHDLQSEHTAQSRQRSASARTSSSLKPRRTSSQVVRRATPSRVFMMRRACGSSGSSSVCGILTLSASESHTGHELLAAQEVVDGAGAAAAGGDRLDRRPGAHRGGVAAGEDAGAAGHHGVGVHLDLAALDGDVVGAGEEVVDDRLADGEDDGVGLELDVLALDRDRRAPAALVGLAQGAALELDAGGDAAAAEDLDGHERVLDVDLLLLALFDLLGRGRRRALVLDAGEGDLVGAAAEGGAAGVVGHVAAADDHHALAGRRLLAERLRAQELDGAHDALLVEAGDRQVLALVQAGGQEDGLVAVGEQRVDGEVGAAALRRS